MCEPQAAAIEQGATTLAKHVIDATCCLILAKAVPDSVEWNVSRKWLRTSELQDDDAEALPRSDCHFDNCPAPLL
jgi:hypothetical protein